MKGRRREKGKRTEEGEGDQRKRKKGGRKKKHLGLRGSDLEQRSKNEPNKQRKRREMEW